MAWLTKCLLPLYILGTFILISYLLNFFPAKDFSLNISGVNDSSKLIFRFSFNNSLPRDVNETSLSFSMSSFIISFLDFNSVIIPQSKSFKGDGNDLRNSSFFLIEESSFNFLISFPISIKFFLFNIPKETVNSFLSRLAMSIISCIVLGLSNAERNLFSGRPFFKYNSPFLSSLTTSLVIFFIFIISLFESHCNDLITSISFNPVSFTNEDSLVCLDNNGRTFLSKGVKDSINLECFEEGSLIPVKNSFFISSMFLGNSFPKYFDFFKYLFPSLTVWNKYQYSLPFILTFFT